MIGIYKIENLINGKIYIGQSINIEKRWKKHKYNSERTNFHREFNKPLYRSIRKYGNENFTFEVIHRCEKESLNKLEIYYINLYCSNHKDFGYNISLKNSISTFNKIDNIILESIISELKTDKPKLKISKDYNLSVQYINSINRGDNLKVDGEKYPIRCKSDSSFLKKPENVKNCLQCGNETINRKYCSEKCSQLSQRIIIRPEKYQLKNEVDQMGFSKTGKKYNVSDNTIRKWLKSSDK